MLRRLTTSAYLPAVTLRSRVHHLLEGDQQNRASAVVQTCLLGLILLNVAAVVLATEPAVLACSPAFFEWFEHVSVAVFTVEYVLRLWSAPEALRYQSPVAGRLRWMVTPASLIDLVSVLPSLLPLGGLDLRSVRLLRLLRIVRIAKIGRYSLAVRTLHNVLRAKAPDLLSLLFLLLVLLVVSSTLMFFLENEAQPETFSSIPTTMWWGIITLTTIGYGDMAPVTGIGRLLGAVIAIAGIAMFALPAGLLGAAFVDELGKAKVARRPHAAGSAEARGPTCPHCGNHLGA